jgi:hypothetical protein
MILRKIRKKGAVITLISLVSAMSLIIGGLTFFLNSQTGLMLSERLAVHFFKQKGDELVIQNLAGTISNFSFTHLTFKSPEMQMDLSNVHLDSLPGMLFLWKVKIKALEMGSLEIQMQKIDEAALQNQTTSQAPSFPKLSPYLFKLLPELSVQLIKLPELKITFPNGRILKSSLDMKKSGPITTLSHFNLRYPPLRLKLKEPTEFKSIAPSGLLTWNNLCLIDNTENQICLSGNWLDNLDFALLLKIDLERLSVLDDIFSRMMNTSGKIMGTLGIKISDGTPTFSGEVNLQDGSTYIPIIGMHPEKLKASIKPEANGLKLVGTGESGSLEFGAGKFTISGLLSPDFLTLSLEGENMNLVNLAAGIVNASPKITYKIDESTQFISGNILLTHAKINGDKIRARASDNTDVAFISPSGKVETQPGHLFGSNISVLLGDDANFTGFGINAMLTGKAQLHSLPGAPILATGQWDITHGEYQTYGKKFLLTRGTLIFNQSPIANPSLNIKAIYDMPPTVIAQGAPQENIQLGVVVTGTVSSPKFGFFSTPPMSQSDILSYIVLGTPLSQASSNQQSQLSQAALSYALNNGNFTLLTDIKKGFGIDSLNVGSISALPAENMASQNMGDNTITTGTNDTAVFIGKQVNPRLYVSYGLGIFNQQQEFKTQWALSNHWSFLTNSATSGNGADIVFTLDR